MKQNGMALDHTARLSCSQIWVAYEEVLGCWRRPGPVYRSVSGHDAFEVRHYSNGGQGVGRTRGPKVNFERSMRPKCGQEPIWNFEVVEPMCGQEPMDI